jgi:hypothetical protein
MGITITGYIETRPEPDGAWHFAVPLTDLFREKHRDGFECLFGVAGGAGFEPVAAWRGLPEDASEPIRAEFGEHRQPFGAGWITWAEIESMDWDAVADGVAFAVYNAVENPDGEAVWRRVDWRPEYNYDLFEACGLEPYDLCQCGVSAEAVHEPWPPGAEWLTRPGVLHRVEPLRRIDVVGPQTRWESVWRTMTGLAEQHGAADVRLVVWFTG